MALKRSVKSRTLCTNGKVIGQKKWYYNNGKIELTGQFNKKGERIGKWIYYKKGPKCSKDSGCNNCNTDRIRQAGRYYELEEGEHNNIYDDYWRYINGKPVKVLEYQNIRIKDYADKREYEYTEIKSLKNARLIYKNANWKLTKVEYYNDDGYLLALELYDKDGKHELTFEYKKGKMVNSYKTPYKPKKEYKDTKPSE